MKSKSASSRGTRRRKSGARLTRHKQIPVSQRPSASRLNTALQPRTVGPAAIAISVYGDDMDKLRQIARRSKVS